MTSPLQGLQQRSEAETLEYLGWASAQLIRFSDVPEQAHSALTAQALVDAGVQVWRHQSGTGHSFVYWPSKMSSPVQCFNPRQAASAIMKQEGWKEALGVDKLLPPAGTQPAAAAAPAAEQAAAAETPAAMSVDAVADAAAAGSAAAGAADAAAAVAPAADAAAADAADNAGAPAAAAAAEVPASSGNEEQQQQQQQQKEGAGATLAPAADAAAPDAAADGSPTSTAAAAAAAVKSEGDAMDVDAAADTGEEVDAAAAAGIDNTGCFPGYTFLRPEKEQQVLHGVADKLTALTRRKFTGAEVRGLGLRAVAETKHQRRQYSIWWPGRMAESEEPVHCAPSYTVGAQKLLAHPACREALGVTSLPSPGAAGPSSSSDAAAAGALIGTKRPAAGDASQAAVDAAAAGSSASYPKRTRAADASEAAGAAAAAAAEPAEEDDVKQPLAALAAAAGLGPLSPARSASAIAAAAAAAKKQQGPVPGSEVLQAVQQYTGSTKEVQGKVKAALQQLADALKLAGDAQHWSPESLKALPGGAVLAAGLDTRSLAPFISEAQEMHDNLTADAAQLEALLAQGSPGSKAAAGSSAGSAGRTRGSGSAAADAAQRKPIVAFRSALEACAADVSAWLKQQRQQDVLQRLQAVNQVKALVDSNKDLKQQLAQVKRQLQEQQQQQQQRRGGSADDGDRGRQGDARRAAEDRRRQQQQEQQRQQLLVLLEQQKQQQQQQLAMRRQQQRQQDPMQREQEEDEAEEEALLLAPQQQFKLQPLQLHHGDVASAGRSHAKPAQVRAAAEALMAAARAKAAAVQDALLGAGAGFDRAQSGAGKAAAVAAADRGDDITASAEPAADAAGAAAATPVAPTSAAPVATREQQEKVPAFPQNAPGSVLQFLQHLMKTGSSKPAANGAASARQEADDMDDDF
uniref:Uncharacterized protein n=1 Tax=Tetradesmus obliquus TaxID=3088 RepID=A0A383W671_TETOB|eukprot:jgi/Sobl393_1/17287/SZX72176.1